MKNYWNIPNSSYRGVNTNWRNPKGYEFELQFHTRHNLQVKDEMHPVYQVFRKETDTVRQAELIVQMDRIGEKYIMPVGVKGVN